ncbi:MAG: hypothetical protein NZM06_03875 [Chloroherpetonaceae bacterium]|nr:hypothetical protein [Chloroherpetonaceae bacterium]MDW8436584.1 hypothetical protein [Chloroherpetonaceae bacterium]
MRAFLPALALLFASPWLVSCAEPETETDPIEGFTRTNQNGQIISEDRNDWRVAARFAGEVSVSQVPFPNPTRNGQVQLTIRFSSSAGISRIDFLGISRDGVPVSYPVILETDLNVPNFGAKTYRLDFVKMSPNRNLAELRGRLFRARMVDGAGNVITYGDVFIE